MFRSVPWRRSGLLSLALLLYCAPILSLVPASLAAEFVEPLGELHLSFEPDRIVSTRDVSPGQPFNFYLIAEVDFNDIGDPVQGSWNGMSAWEAAIDLPEVVILNDYWVQPTESVAFELGEANWIVGTGGCLEGQNTPLAVMSFEAVLLSSAVDVAIDLLPSTPSSFEVEKGGPGPTPGWSECYSFIERLHPFRGDYVDNGIVINSTVGPPDGDLELVMGDAWGEPGGSASASLGIKSLLPAKADGDPSTLSGVDVTISWDPLLASFDRVEMGDAAAGWQAAVNASAGRVILSMASLESIDASVGEFELLRLIFNLTDELGETPLQVSSATAYDADVEPIAVTWSDGVLVVGCEKGNVHKDSEIDSADAIVTLQITVGLYDPDPGEACAADMNSDGEIDVGDAILILRRAVGLDKSGPAASSGGGTAGSAGGDPGGGPKRHFGGLALAPAGDGLGAVLHYSEVAGLDAELRFDADRVRLVDIEGDGLHIDHQPEPGRVRIGLARGEQGDGELLLRFEPVAQGTSGLGSLELHDARVFDTAGESGEPQLGDSQIRFAGGAPPTIHNRLLIAAPNPFNPQTVISLRLASRGDAVVHIYDATGRRVRSLRRNGLDAGDHEILWNGSDDGGRTVASGVYLVRLVGADEGNALRVTLLK